MNIIIDSNILFSALIKDSVTRRIILEHEGIFLFPYFIFDEMKKHKGDLIKKSEMKKEEFDELLTLLLKKVIIVPVEKMKQYKEEAFEIVKDIDPDDIIFVACVLAYKDSILWSDDKKLKNQTRIAVFNTGEIIKILGIEM